MNSAFCVAVHALICLNRRQEQLSSEELARSICTNPARVRKIMAGLKRAGLVETKEGRGSALPGGIGYVGGHGRSAGGAGPGLPEQAFGDQPG